ncbi:J domain-containing protein [Micromonospora luteifusca]|uniref:J domain-containing protein n=1 Tax=Micromonospora luteifusca TaxID=709860 RepID=UPI0033B91CE7
MPSDGQDPYTVLGVTRESSVAEIRERYLLLVQIWHPDRHQSSAASVRAEVTQQMQRINAAYKQLRDADEREARARQDRERQARERQDRERQDRDRQARERQDRERQDRERHDRDREDRERDDREREARKREARERKDPERQRRERQARERETREREHPRAQWTHPSCTGTSPQEAPSSMASTVHPIAIALRSGDRGYTLRAYLDDQRTEAAFLGAQGHLLLFRSVASLRKYLARTEAHELAGIPDWESVLDRIGGTETEPDDENCYEFDLILHSLRFAPTQWIPSLFITNRDLIRELAVAFNIDDVLKLLTVGSPLDHLDDLFRNVDRPIAGWGARRQLASLQGGQASILWRRAIRGVEERVRWLR